MKKETFEELNARNEKKVQCYHFCSTTQKYELFGIVTQDTADKLMPVNKPYAQFIPMSSGCMVAKYRFTELNDSTIPQI